MKCFLVIVAVATLAGWVNGECATYVSDELQKILLDMHNEMRNRVACGNEPGFKPAADMMEYVWSKELAKCAQDSANRNGTKHDEIFQCVVSDTNVINNGQNIGAADKSQPDYKLTVSDFFNKQGERKKENSDERNPSEKDILKKIIAEWDNDQFDACGHAAASMWAKTKTVGCGVGVNTEDAKWGDVCTLYCNYASPVDSDAKQVYQQCKNEDIASKCPIGKSKTYDCLCISDGSTEWVPLTPSERKDSISSGDQSSSEEQTLPEVDPPAEESE